MPLKRKALPRPWRTKKKAQEGRIHNNSKFYQSHKWRAHRRRYLSEYPLCVMCEKDSKVREAKVLDHIIPIRKGGEKWCYTNLQGLCSSCHNKKSGREAHSNDKG